MPIAQGWDCCVLEVVVVDVVGAIIGEDVVDWSVVVVLVAVSELPQPATDRVPAMSAIPVRYLRPYFISVMGNSVLGAFRGKSVKVSTSNQANPSRGCRDEDPPRQPGRR
jgi:hypothetical protein